MQSTSTSTSNVAQPEAILEWLQKEMGYRPLGPYTATKAAMPSVDSVRKVCRGNMIPVWNFLLKRVKSEKTVESIRRNILVHGDEGEEVVKVDPVRREEGSIVIKNTNVFAALETLRKKKKSEKSSKSSSKSQGKEAEEAPAVFWNPTPLAAKSWADVDDEDDDDYYATTAPIQPVWGTDESESKDVLLEESESEEDILDEGDEDVEEEHDQETEVRVPPEPEVVKVPELPSAPKEAERQLSKKEKKKKELAELEALLADFGVASQTDNAQDESRDATKVKKDGDASGVGDEKESLPFESKSAKKKKKKDKSSREVREQEDQPNSSDVTNGLGENAGTENAEEDASAMDVKERLKKMASVKKKKSNRELDGASKAAAIEAAARSAKLAAAKKKEKNHYNQQPVR